MRESLTVLAALLVLLLTAALVGPHFVDWTQQRAIIEARLSEVAGAPVHIHGRIDLRLLPTPYFTFDGVEAGDAKGPISLSAASMQAELAFAPLLRGEIDFVEASLQAPKLDVTLGPDGALAANPPALARDLRFERLVVNGGYIKVTDPRTARTLTFAGVDLDAQADSLRGPFKGEGAFTLAGARTPFRVSTGALDAGKMRIKLIVGQSAGVPRIDAEGTLAFGGAGPSYLGAVALSGPLRIGTADTRWRATGTWRGDFQRADSEAIELRVGDEDHAVAAQGPAQLVFGPKPQIAAQLRTRQVDFDRVLAVDGGPPPLVRVADALTQIVHDGLPAGATGRDIDLAWSIDTLLLGGEPMNELALGLKLQAGRPPSVRVDTSVPGGGRLKLDGALETGAAAAYNGTIDATLSDVDRLAAWSAPIASAPALPFKTAKVAGEISLSAVGFSGRALTLGVDRSMLAGALAFTRPVGGEQGRLFADLQATTLDLRVLPDTGSLRDALHDVDLEVRLAANGVRLDRPGQTAIEAGRLRLDLTKTGAAVHLRDFGVEGFDGVSLSAHGDADGTQAALDGRLNATRLEAAGTLLQRLLPGAAADMVVARARALAPLRLSWNAKADMTAADGVAVTELTLDGTAGATRLSGQIRPGADETNATLQIDAPDTIGLLRQAGLSVLAISRAGPARISIEGHGRFDASFVARARAQLAGTTLVWLADIDPTAHRARGPFSVASNDLTPLLQASATVLPDLTQRIPLSLSGALEWSRDGLKIEDATGALNGTMLHGDLAVAAADVAPRASGAITFDELALGTLAALALGPPPAATAGGLRSTAPFGASLAEPPTIHLALKAQTFGLPTGSVVQDASLQLEVASGLVRLRDMQGRLGSGTLSGALDLRRDGAQAGVEGHVVADNVALAVPGATGRATFDLSFAGTGTSPDALAAALGGSGNLRIDGLTLARADPQAVGRTALAIDDEQQGLDPAEVTRTLRRAFDAGPLVLDTRRFSLGLAGGTLRLVAAGDQAGADGETAGPTLTGAINLRTNTLDARVDLAARDLPKTWGGPVPRVALLFKGPIAASTLTPTIEIGPFLNVMAERAIARDSARIQAFEFDAHERAVANQRLAYAKRRDAERLKAEDDARRAVERKADDEARRAAADKARTDETQRRALEAARRKQQDSQRDGGVDPAPRPSALDAPVHASPDPPPDPGAAGRY